MAGGGEQRSEAPGTILDVEQARENIPTNEMERNETNLARRNTDRVAQQQTPRNEDTSGDIDLEQGQGADDDGGGKEESSSESKDNESQEGTTDFEGTETEVRDSDLELMAYDTDVLSTRSDVPSMTENPDNVNANDIDSDFSYGYGVDSSSEDSSESEEYEPDQKQSLEKKESWLGDMVAVSTRSATELTHSKHQEVRREVDVAFDVAFAAPETKVGATKEADRAVGRNAAIVSTENSSVSVLRVAAVCGCLLAIGFVVILVVIILPNADDDASSDCEAPFNFDATEVPTDGVPSSPVVSPTTTNPPNACPPDNETAVFFDNDQYTCSWLRGQSATIQEYMCQTNTDIFKACRSTCGNCVPLSTAPSLPYPTPTPAPPSSGAAAPTPTIPQPQSPSTPSPSQSASQETTIISATVSQSSTNSPTAFSTEAPTTSATPTQSVGDVILFTTCSPDLPGRVPSKTYDCAWLSLTNSRFRRSECEDGQPAFVHCPTTCESCFGDR